MMTTRELHRGRKRRMMWLSHARLIHSHSDNDRPCARRLACDNPRLRRGAVALHAGCIGSRQDRNDSGVCGAQTRPWDASRTSVRISRPRLALLRTGAFVGDAASMLSDRGSGSFDPSATAGCLHCPAITGFFFNLNTQGDGYGSQGHNAPSLRSHRTVRRSERLRRPCSQLAARAYRRCGRSEGYQVCAVRSSSDNGGRALAVDDGRDTLRRAFGLQKVSAGWIISPSPRRDLNEGREA